MERKQGAWEGMRWWEQAGIGMAGSRETMTEAAEVDEDGMED